MTKREIYAYLNGLMSLLAALVLLASWLTDAHGQTQQTATDYVARRLNLTLLDPPQPVPSASVFVSGNPGPVTFFYWIVSNSLAGASSPAGPFMVSTAPNTLSVSNFVQISWTPVPTASTYDVLRTTTPAPPFAVCNCAVATGVATTVTTDQSNSLNAYSVAPLDVSTLGWTVTNESNSAAVSFLTFRAGGVAKFSISSAGGATFVGNANLSSASSLCWNFDSGITRAAAKSFKMGDCSGSSDGTLTLGTIVSGVTTTGTLTSKNQNGFAVIKVDQYANWAAALADCPAAPGGCILDATSPNSPLSMGTFDVGTRAVTILFGPFAFTANQITLRTELHMLGAGNKLQTGIGVTSITSVGTNATPLMVIPQSNSTPVQSVVIKNILFVGASGNTSQKGLFADCSTLTNSGLWYSDFKNVDFTGFAGPSIHLKGRPDTATALNQILTFTNVHAFRVASGAEALRIENGNGQLHFYNSEFDGQGITDGTNIFIGELAAPDTQSPFSIHFSGLTCQSANLCMQISGVQGLEINDRSHFEALHGAIQASLVGSNDNQGVVIQGNDFFGTVGVNAGNGFLLKNTSAGIQASFVFCANTVAGTPDKIISGTNGNSVAVCNNPQTSAPALWSSSGVTTQINPAATLSIGNAHTVLLNASATSIATLQSSLGPGETVTFRANASTAQFATGGNLDLSGGTSPCILSAGETATFARFDTGSTWQLIGHTSLNGCGFKEQRFGATCTTAAAVGASCTTTETWTSPFPDANYSVSCTGLTAANAPAGINVESIAAATFVVRIFAFAASASSYGGVHCLARHD